MKKTPLLDMDRGVLNIDLFVYCVMLPQGESPLRRRGGGGGGGPGRAGGGGGPAGGGGGGCVEKGTWSG